MQIAPVHSPSHYVPVQPAAPVAPVKAKPESADDAHRKVKPTPPPGVGTRLDITA